MLSCGVIRFVLVFEIIVALTSYYNYLQRDLRWLTFRKNFKHPIKGRPPLFTRRSNIGVIKQTIASGSSEARVK